MYGRSFVVSLRATGQRVRGMQIAGKNENGTARLQQRRIFPSVGIFFEEASSRYIQCLLDDLVTIRSSNECVNY